MLSAEADRYRKVLQIQPSDSAACKDHVAADSTQLLIMPLRSGQGMHAAYAEAQLSFSIPASLSQKLAGA